MISDRDRELLEFEETWSGSTMRKLDQVRRLFDLSGARYIQRILHLCDQVDVEREFPQLVRRIHERSARQTSTRAARARALD
jgi:hypothetical protein